MLLQREITHNLKDFGLNSYESKLWAALLSRGVATAGELSDIANVPRSRSYDVLESLERKGFIMVKIGKPIRYLAVPPQHVVERVRQRIRQEAEEKVEILKKLEQSSLLVQLKTLHKSSAELIDPLELSGSLKGRKNTYSYLDYTIRNASKEVIISTTADGLKRKSESLKNSFKKAKANNVTIKVVAPVSTVKEAAISLSKYADVRDAKENGRYCIVDGKQVIFMLTKDAANPAYDTAIWVNSTFFASAFKSLFDKNWNSLKTVKA